MRRIVVSVRPNGQSFVESDDQIADTGRVWSLDPTDIAHWVDSIDPEKVLQSAQPPAGGALCAIGRVPVGTAPAGATSHGADPAIDERGFHTTKTVDFIYVLDDGLVLDVHESSVQLATGDVVVLQAAAHAWRNTSNQEVRFLDVLVGV